MPAKVETLGFIADKEQVQSYEIADHFGLSRHYCEIMLTRLKKQGLVINMLKNRWELTEEGYRRLEYLRAKGEDSKMPKSRISLGLVFGLHHTLGQRLKQQLSELYTQA